MSSSPRMQSPRKEIDFNEIFIFKIVASAPNFPHGVIDPIEDISKVYLSLILILK